MLSGQTPDYATTRHFNYNTPKGNESSLRAVCKLCRGHGLAKSTWRERKHLNDECPKYADWKAANGEKL